jgi:hypothetical protein
VACYFRQAAGHDQKSGAAIKLLLGSPLAACAVLRTMCSLEVLREVLVHLEHAHLVLASEHRLKLLVRHDLALILRVLELVRLDLVPNLAHHLGAWQRSRAHNGGLSLLWFVCLWRRQALLHSRRYQG